MLDPTPFDPALIRRFESKLTEGPGGCWLWTASKDQDGYGHFFPRRGVCRMAHRWSYEYHVASIPPGLQLDHLCRVRACVNPAHLEPVDQRTNILRGVGVAAINAAAEICKNGHPFTEENTYLRPTSEGRRYGRDCRVCLREAGRKYRAQKRGN